MLTLKNHPFPVTAFFNTSLVLTYAMPAEQLKKLLPPCLEPDCFDEKWGFVAAAIVDTKNLKPAVFPTFSGNDFILIGFRIFVRYTNAAGKKLRGLYILKSETNKWLMCLLGNVFTHYNYTKTDIIFKSNIDSIEVKSIKSNIDIRIKITEDAALPAASPFANWKEARRFAGPLPFTFNNTTNEVLIVEGVRENWIPKPVEVTESAISFIQQPAFKNAVLANAFVIQQIPYRWKSGIIEKWKQ